MLAAADADTEGRPARSNSFSQQSRTSDDSQTAAEFIRDQEILEADAREALPYSIDSCTKTLGSLRQNIFACLTCNPAPAKPGDPWTPAGVCYACSVQCHGEHQLVEIFQKRNFTCDCGTTRLPSTSPCALRINGATNTRGNVHSEEPDANNKYNMNFQNRFCCCECDYDPFQQNSTMFQCLGLGNTETGGCGEDWYHPGCLVGAGSKSLEKTKDTKPTIKANGGGLETISEANEEQRDDARAQADEAAAAAADSDDEPPMPPGFPDEDDFDGLLCYKCVEAYPWIKQYAGTDDFLPPVFLDQASKSAPVSCKKRKAEDDGGDAQAEPKRVKSEIGDAEAQIQTASPVPSVSAETPKAEDQGKPNAGCKLVGLPPAPGGRFSLFFQEGFRDKFCRCSDCYPKLDEHAQLLEEEETYEPPISDGPSEHGGSTVGSGSLLERGESALRNVDRVRAIEGVMAYNHLKEQLKPFFKQFAESGRAVGAEDIKAYFAKLRGDEQGIKEAGEAALTSSSKKKEDGDGDGRREQRGY
ncbi:Protein mlo2 [Escovopsis weberi]|uniref:Protein mlo2 n=1 Tax=Escovopsis weberi TaxID=150374 RepID=A0A0M8MUY9_ESCWE|nr:Protein mlo2 [Escovopsis weberi]